MAKRRWTVVLVPHGSEPSRIVEVSYTVLKVAVSLCVAVVVVTRQSAESRRRNADDGVPLPVHLERAAERRLGRAVH